VEWWGLGSGSCLGLGKVIPQFGHVCGASVRPILGESPVLIASLGLPYIVPTLAGLALFAVWAARFGCGAVFSPDTFSVFTIFGVCQGGKDALTNPKNR
jgi:hypothetical protein